MAKILIEHWQNVDPFSIKAHVANFDRDHRFQMVALDEHKLVGYWTFDPRLTGALISSGFTRVAEAYRRQAIAKRLWFGGIDHYQTRRIKARIGSWQGREFLAQMTVDAWIAHRTKIDVEWDEVDTPLYNEAVARHALHALNHNGVRKTSDPRLQVLAGLN